MWNHRVWVRLASCFSLLLWTACGDDDSDSMMDHSPTTEAGSSGASSAGTGGAAGTGNQTGGKAGSGSAGTGSAGMSGAGTNGGGKDASSDTDGSTSDAGDPIEDAAAEDAATHDAAAEDAAAEDAATEDAATEDAATEQPDSGPDPDDDGGIDEEDDEPWPPPPASEELAALPEQLAEGICDAIERCLGPTLRELVFDGADCVERTTAELEDGELFYLQASIDAQRVTFDPLAVADCVEDYGALECDLVASRAPASCDQVMHGEVAIGGACVIDEDCTGAAFCDRSASCPGECHALLAQGQDCDRDDQCRDGLECLEGECALSVLEGEECEGGVAPECHLGLLCIGADDTMSLPGECRAKSAVFVQAEGEGCDAAGGIWCEEGLACVVDIIDNGGTPSFTQVCAERVASGGDCHTSLVPQQCPAGEYCPADLEPEVTAECVARPGAGSPCGAFEICAADMVCDNGTCRRTRRRIDASCTDDSQCLAGRCVDERCAPLDRCRLDPEPPDPTCGDTLCNGTETCSSCELDCGQCPVDPECGDDACNGNETCSSCEEDCGECAPSCGDDACNGNETCSSCEEDCGECAPSCGDGQCNGTETCTSCDDDCGVCPPVCGDFRCNGGEDCESCEDDCGMCAAPYSGPCDDDSECAPSHVCKEQTSFGSDYGYCAEPCDAADDCSGRTGQRACGSDDHCVLQCSVFECLLFNQDRCCPVGMECIDSICNWLR